MINGFSDANGGVLDGPSFDVADVLVSIKSLMGRYVGVERDATGLRKSVESLASFADYVMRHRFETVDGWELQNLLLTASLIARSALVRTESRGVHFRSDHPEADADWRRHLSVRLDHEAGTPRRGELMPPDPVVNRNDVPCSSTN